ncbi:uncharacterized protein LOC129741636 [Uranotaenia lowii]|uniref:uncharacterized protein LOC129741636 n=1 Tax=Uranotaenia lowii TaxID=190385 RepID=UPI0024793D32|nr:uncharacterized protein LOC129741636 [Uranotaenia lowii]
MADILQQIKCKRASENTIYHTIYGYYFLGIPKAKLSQIYNKHKSTISNWISTYEKNGFFSRQEYTRDMKKFGSEKRSWIVSLYQTTPTLYLNEAKNLFEKNFRMPISCASICRILHQEGFSWKTLERRAIQIRTEDIIRFYEEINSFRWDYHNLIFLDEVSFDNKAMLRSRGYGMKGKRLVCRGEYVRKPRMSLLCFISQEGMEETFSTEGTFNRAKFFDCCRKFCTRKEVFQYPGRNSIWILDGARIHCDPMIVSYLRSMGIIPIFLPAYCPFFMPIEFVFGLVKQYMKFSYKEDNSKNFQLLVMEAIDRYTNYRMDNLFKKCGYIKGGFFDPTIALENDVIRLGFEENSEKRYHL